MKTNLTHILKQYFEGKVLNLNRNTRSNLTSQVKIMRHFPERFTQKTTIVYQLDQTSMVSLVVYNPEVRSLTYLTCGIKEKGSHKVEFDTADLPAGIYVARLRTENGIIKEYMRKVESTRRAS